MLPLKLVFDGIKNVNGSTTVHFPKLNYGAPYSFGLRVRNEDDTYRSWDAVAEIRWRLKLRPIDKHELMVLYKSDGNFSVDSATDTLTFIITADDWENVTLPQSQNVLEMDVPFAFVVEFLDAAGTVVERFAHGSGFITVDLNF